MQPLTRLPDDAGLLSVLRTTVRNPLEAVPEGAYHKTHVTKRMLGRTVVYVAHPDVVRQVLSDDAVFGQSDVMVRSLAPLLGDGVLTSQGPHWLQQRRAATPALRNDMVTALLPLINQAGEQLCDRLLGLDAAADIGPEMMRATLDVIIGALLPGAGMLDRTRFGEALTGYLEQSSWHLALSMLRLPDGTWYPGRSAGLQAAQALRQMMAAAMAAAGPEDGLLGVLRERGGLSEADLLDNLLTFVAAGHETTAVTLAWAMYALAQHPAVAAAAVQEVMDVAPDGEIGAEQVAALGLVRRVVQETLRVYPAASVLVRRATRDAVVGGVAFPAGCTVFLPIYALHRHVAAWDDPERFDPDRFLPDAVRERDRFAYLPFGAGPRVCMGANLAMTEAVVLLAAVLRRVGFRLAEGCAPRPNLRVTLRAKGGVRLVMEARDERVAVSA